jgi:hypothetical protein
MPSTITLLSRINVAAVIKTMPDAINSKIIDSIVRPKGRTREDSNMGIVGREVRRLALVSPPSEAVKEKVTTDPLQKKVETLRINRVCF